MVGVGVLEKMIDGARCGIAAGGEESRQKR